MNRILPLLCLLWGSHSANAAEVVGVAPSPGSGCFEPIAQTQSCNSEFGQGARPCRSIDLLSADGVDAIPPTTSGTDYYIVLLSPTSSAGGAVVDATGAQYEPTVAGVANKCGFYGQSQFGTGSYRIDSAPPPPAVALGVLCCRDIRPVIFQNGFEG